MKKIGIIYDLKENYSISAENLDYCDFTYLSDVEYIKEQLEIGGYETELIGSPQTFFEMVQDGKCRDFHLIYNMVEGFDSRNREGLLPAFCEIFNIPCIGSDAFGVSFTNHKFQTKRFASYFNLMTPESRLFDERIGERKNPSSWIRQNNFRYPLVVKPNREGSSMGIRLVFHQEELEQAIDELIRLYRQEILIEQYIEGADVMSFVIGTNDDVQVYPLVEIAKEDGSHYPLWDAQSKITATNFMPPRISPASEEIIKKQSMLLHKALGLYDISRIDWKIAADGTPYFLESTPLPSLCANGSFGFCAKFAGLSFFQLFEKIIQSAERRLY